MSKHARMKEKERRRQEFTRAHAFKDSAAYKKGPKPKGHRSALYEVREVKISDSGRDADVAEPPKPRDFQTYDSSRGYSAPEPVRSFTPPHSPLESRVSSVDVSSLPPLPADGGLELLFVDSDGGEFVLIGGRNIGLSMDYIIGASASTYVVKDFTTILNRQYISGGGISFGISLRSLLSVPDHRVRSQYDLKGTDVSLADFASLASPSAFQRAERYVAKALKEAAEIDARAQLSGQRSLPSPASAYVPLDPDPSGVYCVLHNINTEGLYVFLDTRTLPGASSGSVVASKRFFEERGIRSDDVPPELKDVWSHHSSLPFKFVDCYDLDIDGGFVSTIRNGVERIFGAPQHRILSFSYEQPPGVDAWFSDLDDRSNHSTLRDLVIRYTNLARQTGRTVFE